MHAFRCVRNAFVSKLFVTNSYIRSSVWGWCTSYMSGSGFVQLQRINQQEAIKRPIHLPPAFALPSTHAQQWDLIPSKELLHCTMGKKGDSPFGLLVHQITPSTISIRVPPTSPRTGYKPYLHPLPLRISSRNAERVGKYP